MNLKTALTFPFLTGLLCASGFALMAVLVSVDRIASFDRAVISFVQGIETPFLTAVMKCFTYIGSGASVTVLTLLIALILYTRLRHRSELIVFVGGVAGSELLNVALKQLFRRARPDIHRLIEVNGFSFPSGHSMMAFSLYGTVAFLIWRHLPTPFSRVLWLLFSAVMIVGIGVSRIYLGVHYPSDVIGGYLASGSLLAASVWWYQRYMEKRAAAVETSYPHNLEPEDTNSARPRK